MILNSPYISGSLTVTGNTTIQGQLTVTGSLSGTASLASNALLLQGTGSTGFATTASVLQVSSSQQEISSSLLQVSASYVSLSGSYNTFSGSNSTILTAVSSSQQQISASYIALSGSYNTYSSSVSARTTQIEQVYATTGSNSFRADQSITGSLVVSSTITAQTLVVQTVTSSIVYSSGSNIFGCDLNSRQTFTGSVNITGSQTVFGNVGINAGRLTISASSDSVGQYYYMSAKGATNLGFSIYEYSGNQYINASGSMILRYNNMGSTAGVFMIASGSSEVLRITAAGNIGIGTTCPIYQLEVANSTAGASFRVYDSSVNEDFVIVKAGSGNFGYSEVAIKGQSYSIGTYANPQASGYTGSLGIVYPAQSTGIMSNQSLVLGSKCVERMRITCGGTVLINNIGGYVEYSRVTISGTCNKNQTPGIGGSILHLTTCETDYPFGMKFNIVGDSCNCLRTMQMQTGDHGLTNQGNITLQHAGGNVGIGTSTPDFPLTIKTNPAAQSLKILGRTSGDTKVGWYSSDNATQYAHIDIGAAYFSVYASNCQAIEFYTNDIERMRITCGGNVGIGTTSNNVCSILDVRGTITNGSTAGSNSTIDVSPAKQSIANGACVDFPSMSGMIVVNDWTDGSSTIFLVGGGSTTAVGSNGGTAGTTHYNSGTAGYRWCNNKGYTANFGFLVFKTRITA